MVTIARFKKAKGGEVAILINGNIRVETFDISMSKIFDGTTTEGVVVRHTLDEVLETIGKEIRCEEGYQDTRQRNFLIRSPRR